MRVYGTIEGKLKKAFANQGIRDYNGYSVDALTFESAYGETYDIDFCEIDTSPNEEGFSFRLKELGATFSEDDWKTLEGRNVKSLERDPGFFETSRLNTLVVYLWDDGELEGIDEAKLANELKLHLKDMCLYMDDGEVIEVNVEGVEIEITKG